MGCATAGETPTEITAIRLVVSPKFVFHPMMRVVAMPFAVTDYPDKTQDFVEADILSTSRSEASSAVIDSTIFRETDLEPSGLLPEDDMATIRNQLKVDLLIFGRQSCQWRDCPHFFNERRLRQYGDCIG